MEKPWAPASQYSTRLNGNISYEFISDIMTNTDRLLALIYIIKKVKKDWKGISLICIVIFYNFDFFSWKLLKLVLTNAVQQWNVN